MAALQAVRVESSSDSSCRAAQNQSGSRIVQGLPRVPGSILLSPAPHRYRKHSQRCSIPNHSPHTTARNKQHLQPRALLAQGDESDVDTPIFLELDHQSGAMRGVDSHAWDCAMRGAAVVAGRQGLELRGGEGDRLRTVSEASGAGDEEEEWGSTLRREVVNGGLMWVLSAAWNGSERHQWQAGAARCRRRVRFHAEFVCPPRPASARAKQRWKQQQQRSWAGDVQPSYARNLDHNSQGPAGPASTAAATLGPATSSVAPLGAAAVAGHAAANQNAAGGGEWSAAPLFAEGLLSPPTAAEAVQSATAVLVWAVLRHFVASLRGGQADGRSKRGAADRGMAAVTGNGTGAEMTWQGMGSELTWQGLSAGGNSLGSPFRMARKRKLATLELQSNDAHRVNQSTPNGPMASRARGMAHVTPGWQGLVDQGAPRSQRQRCDAGVGTEPGRVPPCYPDNRLGRRSFLSGSTGLEVGSRSGEALVRLAAGLPGGTSFAGESSGTAEKGESADDSGRNHGVTNGKAVDEPGGTAVADVPNDEGAVVSLDGSTVAYRGNAPGEAVESSDQQQSQPLRDWPEHWHQPPGELPLEDIHAKRAAAQDVSSTSADLAAIWSLALPSLGAMLSDPLMSLIDTWCVAQLGSVQLAALAPNVAIFNFLFQTMTFLCAATCSLVAGYSAQFADARLDAEDEALQQEAQSEMEVIQDEASRVLSHAVTLALGLGLGLLLLTQLAGPALLRSMGCQPLAYPAALEYLRIRSLSAPAVMVMLVAQGASLGRQDAITPMLVYIVAAVLNSAGDVFLAINLKWGVAGTAWATLAAQCVAAAVFLHFLGRGPAGTKASSSDILEGKGPFLNGRKDLPTAGNGSASSASQSAKGANGAMVIPTAESSMEGKGASMQQTLATGTAAAAAAGEKGAPRSANNVPRDGAAAKQQTLPLRLSWRGIPKASQLSVFGEMALPLITRCFLGMVVYTGLARAVATLGLIETAAHQVAMQVFWTLTYFSEPLSIAAQSLIGLHSHHPKRAKGIAVLLVWLAGGVGACLAVLLAALVYGRLPGGLQLANDAAVMVLVRRVAPQSMLSQFLCSLSLAFEGIAIGSGDIDYLPQMQLLTLTMVTSAMGALIWGSSLTMSSIWWCLVLFFAARLSYHTYHVFFGNGQHKSALGRLHALGSA